MRILISIAVCVITLAFFAGVFVFQKEERREENPPLFLPHPSLPDIHNAAREAVSRETKKSAPDYAKIFERFKGEDVIRVPVKEKLIALSFDGGGNEKGAKEILDILAREKINSSFFLTGHFIEKFPVAARAITEAGHEIAHHALSHKNFTEITEEESAREIIGLEEIARARGIVLAPFFRFPYGARTAKTIARVNAAGYTAARWTVDSLGWQGRKDGRSGQFIVDRVVGKAEPGAIVLMHLGSAKDGSTLDADALTDIIRALSAQGYRFATLSELFAQAL